MAGMVMMPLAVSKSWATREWSVFCGSRDIIDGWSVSELVKGEGCGRGEMPMAVKDTVVATRLFDGKRHKKGLLLWGCYSCVGGCRVTPQI